MRRVLLCALLLSAADARAGGLELDVLGARGVGRAGAVIVSADGGAALLLNPAGLARRASPRLQLGAGIHDTDLTFRAAGSPPLEPCDPNDTEPEPSPTLHDRAGPVATPSISFSFGLGPRVVAGAAYLETGDLKSELPRPLAPLSSSQLQSCDRDVRRLFPHRHAGLSLGYKRQTLAAGAAARVLDWLGLGVAATISRVELAEERHIWAGFDGRDLPVGTPLRDLRLSLSADAPVVPGVSAGALIAPPMVPFELALSGSFRAGGDLEGDAALARIHDGSFPAPQVSDPRADVHLPSTITARTGVRYLGEKVVAEGGAELVFFTGEEAPTWSLAGVEVLDNDQTNLVGALDQVPSVVGVRDHAALRLAADVEVIPTFLWLTAGYAFRTAAAPQAHTAPTFADLGGHTIAVGAEGYWQDLTLSVGYARSLSPATTVSAEETALELQNPLGGGTHPVGVGRYDRATDTFGLQVEIAWP